MATDPPQQSWPRTIKAPVRPTTPTPTGPLSGPLYTRHDAPALEQEFRALWAAINRVQQAVEQSPDEGPGQDPGPEPEIGRLLFWYKVFSHRALVPEFYEDLHQVLTLPAPSTYCLVWAKCVTIWSITRLSSEMPTWELLGSQDRRGTYRDSDQVPWPTLDPARFAYATDMGAGSEGLDLSGAHNWVQHIGFASPRENQSGVLGEYETPGEGIGPDMLQVCNAPQGDTVYLRIRSKNDVFPCFLAVAFGAYFLLGEHVGYTRGGSCPFW